MDAAFKFLGRTVLAPNLAPLLDDLPKDWEDRPLRERLRIACESWSYGGFGFPPMIAVLHVSKAALYVWMFVTYCCSDLPSTLADAMVWVHTESANETFKHLVFYHMFVELLGLSCGFGPLNNRFHPMVVAPIQWMWPGTLKLPPEATEPLVGNTRSILDVALYVGLLGSLLRGLAADHIEHAHLLPIIVILPIIGLLDKQIFLAARAEHTLYLMICLLSKDWVAACQIVQITVWFFAGVSKLGPWFAYTVTVMTSNALVWRFKWMRKAMYRSIPDDMRPSWTCSLISHFGTSQEMLFPLAMMHPVGRLPACAVMVLFHLFICSNMPLGAVWEWNIFNITVGTFLFGVYDASAYNPYLTLMASEPWLFGLLMFLCVVVPLIGNFFPEQVSFLLAYRYYAGNWPASVWLIRKSAAHKLSKLKTVSKHTHEQLPMFYDESTCHAMMYKVMAFRVMQLSGRVLPKLLKRALGDNSMSDYLYSEGESFAGVVLGYSFGEGFFHSPQLVLAMQEVCQFEKGELLHIYLGPFPLGNGDMKWQITDAASSEPVATGTESVKSLRDITL